MSNLWLPINARRGMDLAARALRRFLRIGAKATENMPNEEGTAKKEPPAPQHNYTGRRANRRFAMLFRGLAGEAIRMSDRSYLVGVDGAFLRPETIERRKQHEQARLAFLARRKAHAAEVARNNERIAASSAHIERNAEPHGRRSQRAGRFATAWGLHA